MRYAAFALVLASLTGCGSGWPAFDRSTLPATQWPDADRVVLLDDVTVRFTVDGGEPVADVTEHRRVWYRTPRSIEDVQVGAGYQTGLRDLVDFRGRVISPEGDESTFDRGDGIDRPAFGWGTLFSDSRYVSYQPELKPDAIVETTSTLRYRDMRMWSPGQSFAARVPVAESRLSVHLPPGWQIRHLARDAGRDIEWAPESTRQADGSQIVLWRRTDSAALPRERHAPHVFLMAPSVSIQLTRWVVDGVTTDGLAEPAALSARMYAMQAPRKIADDVIRTRVRAILAEAGPDPAERASKLHAFVRDHIRYVSVQLGMGGWIPHASAEVLDVGYGDCKDKASLLGTMLSEAGIDSRQVTVYAHDGWPLRYGLPTVAGNSNHQVLLVDLPDRTVLVDPTRSEAAFGDVPPELQGADILPLTADGAPVETVALPPPEMSRWSLSQRYEVSPAGRAKGEVEVEAIGPAAYGLRHLLLNERGDTLERKLDDQIGLSAVTVDRIEDRAGVTPTVAGAPLVVRARVHREKGLGPATQVWSLSPDAFVPSGVRRIDSGARVGPIVLGPPRVRHHRVALALPAGRRPGALPDPVTLDAPFAAYALSWHRSEDGVGFERRLTWKRPWIEAADADAYRAFADGVLRADARALVLRVDEAPPAAPPPADAPAEPTSPAPESARPTARLDGGHR